MADRRGPRTAPLDPPMVPFALAGTVAWAAVAVVALLAGAPTGWLRTSLAGVLLGLGLLAAMLIRDRRRRLRRAAAPPVSR